MAIIMKFCIFFVVASCLSAIESKVPRPRGVPISKASFYQGSDKFKCFDGHASIPLKFVNDDYCDCSDGSDEPGTAACSNGKFHCTNAGFRPMNLPSSRINDHICDCCDGSDEYTTATICPNTCRELGAQARVEKEKNRLLLAEGHKTYEDYCKQGKQAREEKNNRKETLLRRKDELKQERDNLEAIKNEKETPEKEAKETHKKAWEEIKQQNLERKEERRIQEAFDDLDTNGDNWVTPSEIQVHKEFDIDNNGDVSMEEAKEYLEDQDQVAPDLFKESVWPNIKDIFKMTEKEPDPELEKMERILDADMAREQNRQVPPHPHLARDVDELNEDDDENMDETDDDVDDEEEDDEEGEEFEETENPAPSSSEKKEGDGMPDYDEATKKLIEEADHARGNFAQVDTQFKNLEKEIEDIQNDWKNDFGPNDEFYPLFKQCFEYTESQYTYKLCPFDKTSQRGKQGGAETSLGRWNDWKGPDDNKYKVMLFDNGQGCWNGPNRSVKVLVACSVKNELIAASEPNRCEYEFKFLSPAACHQVPIEHKDTEHDEL